MSTPSRYFGTTIPLSVLSTFLVGFVGLTLTTHAAAFPGQTATTLSQAGLIAFGITVISVINLLLLRKKTAVRVLFGTVVEGAKGTVLFLVGEQFFMITGSTTLEWTKIATIIPILTIISLYLPRERLEAVTSRKWGRRMITAMPSLLFVLLLLSGYLVEMGKTRHREFEPVEPPIETQYFESGFKVSFWKGIQLEAPEDIVFVVDPAPTSDLQRLWRIQVWDRYTTRDWQKSLQETENLFENPGAWRDPIPEEQDELVNLVTDPTIYEITIPIDHSETAAQMYQDYLPTGWWDAEKYGTYIIPNSFRMDTEVPYTDRVYSVEIDYSTYQKGILFEEEGLSNLTYSIDYYAFNHMWPAMASLNGTEVIDERILPRVETYLQLPRVGGIPYPDPSQHPFTYGNATALKESADAQDLTIYERAIRVNDFLANTYRFDNESFFGTELAEEQPENVDMVEWFLSQGKGTHVHFASAMAVFLRYQGIPCRVVRGYGQGDDVKGRTLVRQKHIIVWVEVFIPYTLEGVLKGRWRPFFPLLPLGATPQYMIVVWPGVEPLPMVNEAQIFEANTAQPFQLNALVMNNETSPPTPVSGVPVTFLNIQTGRVLGEGITNQEGIAAIETAFAFEEEHGQAFLGAKTQDSSPTPSIIPIVHRKYDIQWLIEPPSIVVQGRSYPLSVRLARTLDNSGIGPGINVTFGDNLYGAGAILYETPTKYWALTNEESTADVEFRIPRDVEYPLGNHTVLAEFRLGTENVSGYSTPFFVVGAVIIQPSSQLAASRTGMRGASVTQIVHPHQETETTDQKLGVLSTLKIWDWFKGHVCHYKTTEARRLLKYFGSTG